MASQCTQIPTMICPCQSSLRQTLPSRGSTFFSGPQTCHAFSCPNATTCSPGTFLPRSHMMLLSWLEVLWRYFPWTRWPRLLLLLSHWHPPFHCPAHILQRLFLYYYLIIYCFPCSLLVFPHWSMNSRRAGTFLLLFTSVCPVPAHNRQWIKITHYW